MKQHKISYGHQYITDEDIAAVVKVLKSDYMTQGPEIPAFEEAFAKKVGSKYAVAVSNGTAALHISAMSLGVKTGDNVIVSPMTFVASANCVRYCGGNVCFCDIDPETYLIDIHKLEKMLESKPKGYYKGVIFVDFAGYPVNSEKIRVLCDKYGMWMIEDACHAPGAHFVDSKGNRQMAGNGIYSDLTVFSFHPVKHIATGEGGMITTNNDDLYYKLKCFRSHGICQDPNKFSKHSGGWYYEMQDLGFNYRITDMQCALGISQLKRLDWSLQRRQEIAKKYDETFKNVPQIKTPKIEDGIFHAYHLYVIQIEKRKELFDFMRSIDIFVQVHYEPVHLMPYYRNLGNKEGDLPIVEDYSKHCLSLPIYPTLTDEEQNWVIEKMLSFFDSKA